MTDYSALKKAAEYCRDEVIRSAGWEEMVDDSDLWGPDLKYVRLANPAAVLALIAENERLREHKRHLVDLREADGFSSWAEALVKIDQLKVEVEALRKDAERYRWLRVQRWDISAICVVIEPKKSVRLGCYCPSEGRLDLAIDSVVGLMRVDR